MTGRNMPDSINSLKSFIIAWSCRGKPNSTDLPGSSGVTSARNRFWPPGPRSVDRKCGDKSERPAEGLDTAREGCRDRRVVAARPEVAGEIEQAVEQRADQPLPRGNRGPGLAGADARDASCRSAQRADRRRDPCGAGRMQHDRVVVQLRYFVDAQPGHSAAPAHQLLLGIEAGRLAEQSA